MAHFAELDENNIVLRVIVISNDVTYNQSGIEEEKLGIAFCKSLYGENTKWVQTSYNKNIRGIYAMQGDLYDPEKDEFICTPKDELFYFGSDIIDAEVIQGELEAPVTSEPTE